MNTDVVRLTVLPSQGACGINGWGQIKLLHPLLLRFEWERCPFPPCLPSFSCCRTVTEDLNCHEKKQLERHPFTDIKQWGPFIQMFPSIPYRLTPSTRRRLCWRKPGKVQHACEEEGLEVFFNCTSWKHVAAFGTSCSFRQALQGIPTFSVRTPQLLLFWKCSL